MDRHPQSRRGGCGGSRLAVGHQDRELIAAYAGWGVDGTQLSAHGLADLCEGHVAGRVAPPVVDRLEPVDISKYQGERSAIALASCDLFAE